MVEVAAHLFVDVQFHYRIVLFGDGFDPEPRGLVPRKYGGFRTERFCECWLGFGG